MDRRISLDQVRIAVPCQANWNAMAGDDQRRFCAHCSKHVHNLSAMTRSAAEELVCQNAGELCVQFMNDTQGRMITLDYAPVIQPKWWSRWAPLAITMSIASSALALIGLSRPDPQITPAIPGKMAPIVQPIQPVVKGEMVMGDIALPMPTTNPTTAPTTQPEEK